MFWSALNLGQPCPTEVCATTPLVLAYFWGLLLNLHHTKPGAIFDAVLAAEQRQGLSIHDHLKGHQLGNPTRGTSHRWVKGLFELG